MGETVLVLPQIMTKKRNDYGKAVRKDYESHKIREQRKNMVDLVPRTDSICNTISTVTKDNLLLEAIPCAMRGRYINDADTVQRLEIHNDGIQNAITTISKDSMVLERVKNEKI